MFYKVKTEKMRYGGGAPARPEGLFPFPLYCSVPLLLVLYLTYRGLHFILAVYVFAAVVFDVSRLHFKSRAALVLLFLFANIFQYITVSFRSAVLLFTFLFLLYLMSHRLHSVIAVYSVRV